MTAIAGIYRGRLSFEQGFTRIPNGWLRDPNLGFRAKGLLAYLLSHEVGYTITLGQIERETNDGRHAIRSAMDELIAVGYLTKERTHDARGYNAGLAWYLSDPNPEFENPTLDYPRLENRPAYREENLKEKKTKEEVNPQAVLEDEFEEFWTTYPRKVEKIAARKAFVKAAKVFGVDVVLDGARRLANDPNAPAKQFIPYPASWLNAGGWTNEPYPERVLTADERLAFERREIQRKKDAQAVASAQLRAEAERARREAEANPPEQCSHGRVKVICSVCSPINVRKSN